MTPRQAKRFLLERLSPVVEDEFHLEGWCITRNPMPEHNMPDMLMSREQADAYLRKLSQSAIKLGTSLQTMAEKMIPLQAMPMPKASLFYKDLMEG